MHPGFTGSSLGATGRLPKSVGDLSVASCLVWRLVCQPANAFIVAKRKIITSTGVGRNFGLFCFVLINEHMVAAKCFHVLLMLYTILATNRL